MAPSRAGTIIFSFIISVLSCVAKVMLFFKAVDAWAMKGAGER
jgi:lipoprotein